MSSTEDNNKKNGDGQAKIGDSHPLGKLLDGWADWVAENKKGSLSIDYDEDDDVFAVSRDGRKAVLYTSDIDERFYGEGQALFAESEIGIPPQHLDWSQTLQFSGNELVLSRISLSERDDSTVLLVEGAVPISKIEFPLFDLLVREVATIGRDLRRHLADVLEMPASKDDDESEEVAEAEEEASAAG